MSKKTRVDVWIEWSPNEVRAITASGEAIRAEHTRDLKGKVGRRAMIIAGRNIAFLKTVRIPSAKPSEIAQIVRFQAQQLFSSAHGELGIGYRLAGQPSPEGRLAIVGAVPLAIVDEIYSDAEAAGFHCIGIVPRAAGSAFVAKRHGHASATVVELREDGAGIDLIENGEVVYSRLATPGASAEVEINRARAASGLHQSPVIKCGTDSAAGPTELTKTLIESFDEQMIVIQSPKVVAHQERAVVANRSRLAMLLGVAAIGVVALVWDGRDQAESAVQKQRVKFTNAIRGAHRLRDGANSEFSKFAAIDTDLDRAFEPAQPVGDVVTLAGNNAPNDIWLSAISLERGKPLLLRGVAISNEAVGAYLEALTNDDRFRDVKLVFANQAVLESTNVVQFSMSAHVVGNLPAAKTKQERRKK